MYHLFEFIFQFIFLCTGNFSVHLRVFLHLIGGFNVYRLFVFIFQFIFSCNENFPSICGNYPVRWSRGVRGVGCCGGL